MLIGIALPVVLVTFAFFYVFRGYAVLLVLGISTFGGIMLANGANFGKSTRDV